MSDLKINGLGQAVGGTYGKISIDGIGTLNGDTVCDSLTVNGTLKAKQSIQGGDIRVNGSSSVGGTVEGGRLRVDGTLKVGGDVRSERMDINGMLRIGGGAVGEILEIDGGLKAVGNVEFETVQVYGGIQVGGMLNAGTLEIKMAGVCQAREIGGERIRVEAKKGSRKLLALFSSSLGARLRADVIEGDDIVLEDTTADVVRGSRVRIGPGCEIGVVEYRHVFEADPKAAVGRAVQL
ncbi:MULTISPECIES: hypothetical protein [Paenibacillus]|uniref:hypothetical protein n=1 Tax=Paenibacillus TaxID=44249 RepID=UPI002FDF4661